MQSILLVPHLTELLIVYSYLFHLAKQASSIVVTNSSDLTSQRVISLLLGKRIFYLCFLRLGYYLCPSLMIVLDYESESDILLTPSRNPLPALKCGINFAGMETVSPDFGLRPIRGGR